MGELFRGADNAGKSFQWCSAQLVMVLDRFTGKPERFYIHRSIGPLEDALAYVKERKGREERLIIVQMDCIQAYEIDPTQPTS